MWRTSHEAQPHWFAVVVALFALMMAMPIIAYFKVYHPTCRLATASDRLQRNKAYRTRMIDDAIKRFRQDARTARKAFQELRKQHETRLIAEMAEVGNRLAAAGRRAQLALTTASEILDACNEALDERIKG